MTKKNSSLASSRKLIGQHDAVGATMPLRIGGDHAFPASNADHGTVEDLALMMAQYLEIKSEYSAHILFFHVGCFYMLFFDDATVASQTVGMALKHKTLLGTNIPLCGASDGTADDYLQGLVRAWHSVAICEEVEDPNGARQRGGRFVIRRAVTRTIRPIRPGESCW